MCTTWYLSMPVGTIFAFRVNAQATLGHLHDAELDTQLSAEDAERKTLVGYVRDVSPNGLDIGLLVSEAHAYDGSASIDPLHPAIRKGLAVHTETNDAPAATSPRARRHSHPLRNAPHPLFGGAAASSRNPFSSIAALPVLQPKLQMKGTGGEGFLAALATNAPSLHPTAALPASWGRAFAYRPNLGKTRAGTGKADADADARSSMHLSGQDDCGALRVPLGARHRLVVGGYSAKGVAARPQTRFSRREIARAERVMDGLREEEEEEREERAREREIYGYGTPTTTSSSSSPTSTSSSGTSSVGFGGEDGSRSSLSEGSSESVDLGDNSKPSDARASESARVLPIVIDIILDLESVASLPASPEEFEQAIARLERMERSARRRIGDSIDEWTAVLKEDGDKWKTGEAEFAV